MLQEAQLPQRNSALAAHMEGSKPSSPLPLRPLWLHLYAYGRIRNPQQTYVKRAVRKAPFKLNRAFKVMQGHPYWCRHKSRTVCRRNVQLMPMLFLKLTKRRIRRFQRPHSGLKTSQQEMPSNIYKWFILPKTRVIDLHFCR